jgi:hypothetical protein
MALCLLLSFPLRGQRALLAANLCSRLVTTREVTCFIHPPDLNLSTVLLGPGYTLLHTTFLHKTNHQRETESLTKKC